MKVDILRPALKASEEVNLVVTHYTCIREAIGSNLCRDTDYLDEGFFVVFPVPLGKCWHNSCYNKTVYFHILSDSSFIILLIDII